MKVFFIGAGPGAADLITVRGQKLIASCEVCLYAGSLVPPEIIKAVPKGALVKDTALMNLQEIISEIKTAHKQNKNVARVHSGDPSIYGAIAEQMRVLDSLNIQYEVVPGVPAFAGAAARLCQTLTLPEISQTVIITRTQMKATALPSGETLANLARTKATLAIHLSIRNSAEIYRQLAPHYGDDCPVIIAYRATWPDELYIKTTLKDMQKKIREAKLTRTSLILVGKVFANNNFRAGDLRASNFRASDLYNANYSHILRNKGKKKLK